ncbi:MAG: mandelate racemase/muconate lactonizing enzyme family protein [Chloroflexi bacterium]|nr:mandelate racemase/muconate lactonizing enzyme family protein [Chloroflexota bacterium]
MKIESIDLFYLSMPEVLDIGDGSQDALIVRVRAGGLEGFGECEASPLTTIAAMVCPLSHSACKPVQASVLGQELNEPADVLRIGRLVRQNSFDLLQADHALSGVDMALWDLLGKKRGEPVWRMLGWNESHGKEPYASLLFGDTPQETLEKGRAMRALGYRAIKFGWGPYGWGTLAQDEDQVHAAREGIGADGILLVDAGTVFGDDVEAAALRVPSLIECGATWFEEPFVKDAFDAHARLAARCGPVKLAGGEGSHNGYMAQHMIDYAALGFVQIDAGRIGGLAVARDVAHYADAKGAIYVNHTFTSHLALSASLQPFAGLREHTISEYPVELKPLARDLTHTRIERDADGLVRAPDAPGLGVDVDITAVRPYLVDAEIRAGDKILYRTPQI